MALQPSMSDEVFRFFERGSWVYPQPVAMSCGRIIRTRSPEQLVDAIFKGGEILARYLATVSLASFRARTDANASLCISSELSGSLAYGTFLAIIQQAAKHDSLHPAKAYLQAAFTQKNKPGKVLAKIASNTEEALTAILNVRNSLGHSLASLTSAQAISILNDGHLQEILVVAMKGVEGLLQLPLFVIEQQLIKKGKVIGQRLLLMGEASDPQPENIELSSALEWDGDPYIAVGNEALHLSPMVVWKISYNSANYRLFVFDSIQDRSVKYKAVEVSVYESSENEFGEFHSLLSGGIRPLEKASLASGMSMWAEWNERRKSLEQAKKQVEGRIPWNFLSNETLTWYASKLPNSYIDTNAAIQFELLDGRDYLSKAEVDQLIFLFGKNEDVKKLLGRELLDLRAVKTPGIRWDERIQSHSNLIECLRLGVDFFSRHIGIQSTKLEELKATSGSADYIAMREALINLFIHQDFSDQSCAAQIEISAEKAVFFNPGRSLVKRESLIEGGKSQARNPIIARALRLIGFAELAGSGLRQLQDVWRKQHRRPPKFDSNQSANTFTLTLDWRLIPDNYNSFWQDRLGVKLAENEATILNLSFDGLTVEDAASATGLSLDSTKEVIDKLVRQVLVEEKKGRFEIKDHLRALIQERSALTGH